MTTWIMTEDGNKLLNAGDINVTGVYCSEGGEEKAEWYLMAAGSVLLSELTRLQARQALRFLASWLPTRSVVYMSDIGKAVREGQEEN